MTSKNQITHAQFRKEEAVDEIYKLVLSGASDFEIRFHVNDNYPQYDSADLLLQVVDQLRQPIDGELATAWAWHAARMVYQKFLNVDDLAGALKAVKVMADLGPKLPCMADPECPHGSTAVPAMVTSQKNAAGKPAKATPPAKRKKRKGTSDGPTTAET